MTEIFKCPATNQNCDLQCLKEGPCWIEKTNELTGISIGFNQVDAITKNVRRAKKMREEIMEQLRNLMSKRI